MKGKHIVSACDRLDKWGKNIPDASYVKLLINLIGVCVETSLLAWSLNVHICTGCPCTCAPL
jgi:hypothetical protein